MNELNSSNSAYLKHHAQNPIHWKTWSEKTLDTALLENKLIILSIGYSACHWCHVMERETFSNQPIGSFMNQNFISIKVDREEHPDVDNAYMDFIMETKGNGGWPLNCILTPETTPLYAGTYFQTKEWMQLINRFNILHKDHPETLLDFTQKYSQHLLESSKTTKKSDFNFSNEFSKWSYFLDIKNGGINSNQKFPLPTVLNFSMLAGKSKDWDLFINLTLEKISQRGLFDHLEGGFFRYCVDQNWNIPHFEKMLYDNAQLISVFSIFDFLNKNTKNEFLVLQTIDYWLELSEKNQQLFPASVDADNKDGEGAYYIFKKSEIHKNLNEQEQNYCKSYFNMTHKMLWENNWHMHRTIYDNSERAKKIIFKLKKIRKNKSFPAIDNKAICSWNCMMVIGLLDASITYNKKEFLHKAEILLKLILKKFTNEKHQCNRLVYTNNVIKGTLEDYAWLISAAIKMGKIKNSSYWLEKSIHFTEVTISKFWQKEKNLFRLSNDQKLFKDVSEVDDQVIPSSNSVMASNLYEIYKVTYDKYFLKICNNMLSAVALNAESSPSNFTNWMLLSMKVNNPKKQYVMVGFSVQELLEFYSEKEFFEDVYLLEKQSDLPIFKEKYKPNKKYIFICNDKFCLPAVLTTKQALNLEI
jgi:uncharacterized protein YyaL (SSP411 family)